MIYWGPLKGYDMFAYCVEAVQQREGSQLGVLQQEVVGQV